MLKEFLETNVEGGMINDTPHACKSTNMQQKPFTSIKKKHQGEAVSVIFHL